jgi:hypothetical protein
MTTNEIIADAMARAFFACAWAEMQEENEVSLYGCEIMDVMPEEIDPAASHAAFTLACGLRIENKVTTLEELFDFARDTFISAEGYQGADRPLTPELFGHYLAMQSMGAGVGLESFGRCVRDAITVPYVEFGSHSLEKDY